MTIAELVDAARVAIFEAIDVAHAAAASGAAVCDVLLAETKPNFVQVGDLEWTNEGGKDEVAVRLTVDIYTVYQGSDRAEMIALMAVTDGALQGVRLQATGIHFAEAELLAGGLSGAARDGVTFAGQQTYEIYAEAV